MGAFSPVELHEHAVLDLAQAQKLQDLLHLRMTTIRHQLEITGITLGADSRAAIRAPIHPLSQLAKRIDSRSATPPHKSPISSAGKTYGTRILPLVMIRQ
jgi:hypothetical protein